MELTESPNSNVTLKNLHRCNIKDITIPLGKELNLKNPLDP